MSDYTKTTDFAAKDDLTTGNANKVVSGTEIDDEFNNIATAVATKFDSNDLATQAQAEGLTLDTVLITPHSLNDVLVDNAGMLGDIQALADPNADRILFWDDSAGAAALLTVGTNLSISGTTISAPTATLEAALNHDNLTGFVADEHVAHSGVTLTAGTGLTGGGTIAASRQFDLDISGLASVDIDDLVSADTFLVNDGGVMKQIAKQDIGIQVSVDNTNQTFGVSDANQIHVCTDAGAVYTVPPNSTTAFPEGTVIYCAVDGTGTITLDPGAGVEFNSIIAQGSTDNRTVLAGGTAALIKVATDSWMVVGDIS